MAKKQIGDIDYNVEFNDSVLSTKTWNNPRYDGCETKTQTLNKFTQGDISYGKKTAVQKYTRNIYVGEIITQASSSNTPDIILGNNSHLTPFSGFSYVSSNTIIIVNDDDNITQIDYNDINLDEKKGYYRSFTEDFSIGSDCQILLLVENVENSLKGSYNVYFNGGRLDKILYYKNGSGSISQIVPQLATAVQPTFGKFFPFNQSAGPDGEYHEGATVTIPDNNSFNSINSTLSPGFYTNSSSINTLMSEIQTDIEYSPFNRYFLTLTRPQGNTKEYGNGVSYTIPRNDSVQNVFVPPNVNKTFSAIGTFEIQHSILQDPYVGINGDKVLFSNKLTPTNGLNILGVDFYISKLNDNTPSILVKLEQTTELPNGLIPGQFVPNPFGGEIIFQPDPAQRVGPKFVIIPENLHPYIKENINYFLIKAGLMEENNKLTINPKNRQLS